MGLISIISSTQKRVGLIGINTLVMWFRIVAVTFATIFTTRFLLSALGVEAFGVYVAATSVAVSLSFLSNAMQVTTLRALAINKGNFTESALMSGILGLHLVVSLIILMIGLPLGYWMVDHVLVIPDRLIQEANICVTLVFLTSAISTVLSPYEALLQAKERFAFFAFLNIGRAWLLLPLSFFLNFYSGNKIILYVLLSTTIQVGVILFGAIISIILYPMFKLKLKALLNLKVIKQQIQLFSWTTAGSINLILRTQGVAILANAAGGLAASTALSIATQVKNSLLQISSAISTVMLPRVYGKEAEGNRDSMFLTSLKSCRFSSLVAVTFAIPLFTYADVILELWLGTVVEHTAYLTRLLICILIIDQLSAACTGTYLAIGKLSRIQIWSTALTIIFIFLSIAFKKLGFSYIRIIELLGFIVTINSLFRVILLKPYSPNIITNWLKNTVLPVFYCLIFGAIIAYILHSLFEYFSGRIFTSMVILGISSILINYLFGINNDEKIAIKQLMSKFKL